MNDELMKKYFDSQAEKMEVSFDEEAFLKRLHEETDSKPEQRLSFSGLAMAAGLIILFSISLIPGKGHETSSRQSWLEGVNHNIHQISEKITKEVLYEKTELFD